MSEPFDITEHVEFDGKGRAPCPSCAQRKGQDKKKNLSLHSSGAYHCFAGCTPEDIRTALGATKDRIIPTAIAHTPPTSSLTVSPQKVKEAHERLLGSDGPAKQWLHDRGINDDIIRWFHLGVTRAKCGDRHLPSITIFISNDDGTAYWQKKRIAPWLPESEQPPEYKPWSQAGIPARVWFTHLPGNQAVATWLCEGEWDAMLLGYKLFCNNAKIACATFTSGAGTIPPAAELEKLPGIVYVFYDRNDKPTAKGVKPGEEGAKKACQALGSRGRIALVPMPEDCQVHGWDVSDALNHGFAIADFEQAAREAVSPPSTQEEKSTENPLKLRLVTNQELMTTAPDYVDFLVPDLLPANEMILLAAPPRAGKSLFSMGLAKAVAMGENFLDRPVTQGTVLYVRCEDAPVKIKQRELAQGWNEDIPVYWLDRFKLSQTNYLRDLAEELDCRLIILDTLSRIRDDGVSESSAEMSRVLEPLQELAEDLNCCIIPVHHTNKVTIDNAGDVNVFDTIRGSSAIRATCRGTLVLAADGQCYRLCAENGYGKTDLKVRLDTTTLEWKLIGRWTEQVSSDLKTTVLDYLNKVGEATLEQIFDDTQIPKNSLYKTLSRLVGDNMLTKEGHRRKVVYKRLIGLIGQSDTLSDDGKADDDDDRGTYRTKNSFLLSSNEVISDHPTRCNDSNCNDSAINDDHPPERVIIGGNANEKGDSAICNTRATESGNTDVEGISDDDHFDVNDHPSDKGVKVSDSPSNASPVRVSSSDKSSDKCHLSDEADLSVEDRVEIIADPFFGKIATVEGFTGDKILVKAKGWYVTRAYARSELKLVKRGGEK